jgi:hypothetical protein
MENHTVYEKMYPAWREVYKAQLELSDKRITRNIGLPQVFKTTIITTGDH